MRSYYIIILFISASLELLVSAEIQHLRLIWTENPQSEATIIWDTEGDSRQDHVEIWKKGAESKQIIKANFKASYYEESLKTEADIVSWVKKREKEEQISLNWHVRHVKVTGLSPDTTYELVAHCDNVMSQKYQFKTAPEGDRPFKLIFVGDSRSRVDAAQEVSEKIAELASKDPLILATLHGGDFAYSPLLKQWMPWLKAWNLTTQKDGTLMPLIPVVGNHESPTKAPFYKLAYGFPGGEHHLFSCQLQPNFRIAILNSEIPSTGVQEEFLIKTLEHYKEEKVRWQLVAYHRPVYPAVKKPSTLARFIPIFEKYDIDLALESDGHNIKRTVPIKDGKQDPTGVVYLGEGGYGAPQRTPKDRWYLKEPGFASKGDHLMILSVLEKSIEYHTLMKDGSIPDQHVFKSKR